MDLGMTLAGVNVIQSIDNDPKATDCMKLNPQYFDHSILNDDITQKTVLSQADADMMIFTYPCTKYSAIADIHGCRTGDDLFLHALRHIALKQPEMYIVENVPGMKKFPVVMETISQLPDYHYNIFCPLDANLWVPQNRKRLILFGTRKPFDIKAPQQAANRPKIKDLLEVNPKYDLPPTALTRLKGGYRDLPIIVNPNDDHAVAPTCVAHYAKDKGTRVLVDPNTPHGYRAFTIREWARLQGFPDDFKFPDAVASYRLIGNAVEVNMSRWAGEQAVRYFNKRA